jgi:hypothetical protein
MNSFAVKTILKLAMLSPIALALTQTTASANVVYDLTLTPTSGPSVSGTGVLTLETAVPLTGSFNAAEGGSVTSTSTDLISLTFTMSDGDTFSTAHEDGSASAFFSNDQLLNLSYNLNSPLPALEIGGTSYNFVVSYESASTNGKISLTPTPEPGSVWLAIPAFALFGGLRLRKPR